MENFIRFQCRLSENMTSSKTDMIASVKSIKPCHVLSTLLMAFHGVLPVLWSILRPSSEGCQGLEHFIQTRTEYGTCVEICFEFRVNITLLRSILYSRALCICSSMQTRIGNVMYFNFLQRSIFSYCPEPLREQGDKVYIFAAEFQKLW